MGYVVYMAAELKALFTLRQSLNAFSGLRAGPTDELHTFVKSSENGQGLSVDLLALLRVIYQQSMCVYSLHYTSTG